MCLFLRIGYCPETLFFLASSQKHRAVLKSPFCCPECVDSGQEVLISCRYDWTRHVSEHHAGDNGALLVQLPNGVNSAAAREEENESGIPETLIDPVL